MFTSHLSRTDTCMRIEKRDWIFITMVAVVLAVFIGISGEEKTKPVKKGQIHQTVYETANKNAPAADDSIFKKAFFKPDKKGAEKLCEPCHSQQGVKLPSGHPPKHRCLFCHKLVQ